MYAECAQKQTSARSGGSCSSDGDCSSGETCNMTTSTCESGSGSSSIVARNCGSIVVAEIEALEQKKQTDAKSYTCDHCNCQVLLRRTKHTRYHVQGYFTLFLCALVVRQNLRNICWRSSGCNTLLGIIVYACKSVSVVGLTWALYQRRAIVCTLS